VGRGDREVRQGVVVEVRDHQADLVARFMAANFLEFC
jgi:hypothetical protein